MRVTQNTDYYHLLGLPPSATAVEIKSRYRTLSKQHHPDRGGSQAEMARLNHAYAVLSDKFKRAIYDAERRRHLQATMTQPATQRTSGRQPAPRTATGAQAKSTPQRRPRRWWPKIALGFAGLVIVAGILLNLPIAEAITTNDNTQPTNKPLEVSYPAEPSSQTVSSPNPTFYTSPDGTNYSAAAANQPVAASSEPKPATPENKADEKRGCQTKTYGPYQRTLCRTSDGTKVCSVNSLGSQRFGDCD